MSYQATVIEILLAGPGDVAEERREIADAIERWNQRHARQMNLVMRPVTWETDTYPELGADPQAIINRQIAGRCAAVIAIFATRLGSATPRAVSGTAEEIDRFEAEGKLVAVYFSEGKAGLKGIDIDQLQSLQIYKKLLENRGLYRGYKSIDHLKQLIDQHLAALGYRFQAQQQAHEPQQVGARADFEPTETDMRVIAAIGRLVVETGLNNTSSLYLEEEPELSGVSQENIFESIRVLRGRDLVTGATPPNQGRWEVGLTSDGLEMWLLNFIPNYAAVQRQVARAVVSDDIRDPSRLSRETGIPATIVDHVLQRWAARDLVILSRLYDGWRIDRYTRQLRQLAESRVDRENQDVKVDQQMDGLPRYRTVAEPLGVDVIALSEFGGELGDPIAAALKVDGWTVVQVVAPAARSEWGPEVEEKFRSQVRQIAVSHDLLGRQGEVRLVFDPPQSSTERRDVTSGELVGRQG